MLSFIAYAASPGVEVAASFVGKFNEVILFPIITLLTAVALLVFMWGCFQYIAGAANPAARAEGQKHIMWGLVGLFLMLSAFAILSIAANTFGLNDNLDCANDPSGPGCGRVLTPFDYVPPAIPDTPSGPF